MTGLDSLSWPSVPPEATVLLPIGSTEQHGPHLPFDTDAVIARAVASAVGERMRAAGSSVVVAPVLAYGASGEHQSFAGTISIGHEALRFVLIELVRSLSTWVERIVIVNGHGGNVPTLVSAVPQLRGEGHRVAWVSCSVPVPVLAAEPVPVAVPVPVPVPVPAAELGPAPLPAAVPVPKGVDAPGDGAAGARPDARPGIVGCVQDASAGIAGPAPDASAGMVGPAPDAHAGRTETSLMLHLAPTTVALPLPGPGAIASMAELMPLMEVDGVAAVSPSGILGDPTGATPEEGAALLDAMVADALRRITADVPDAHGMLR